MIASPTGEGHPVHCLTRGDVALYGGGGRLISLQWHHQATSVEVRSRGHKGDQAQQGSDIVRTRDDAWGRGTVALTAELLSGYPTLPERSPVSSYLHGNEVRV